MKIELLNEKNSLNTIPFNRSIISNLKLRESLRKYGFIDTVKVIETSLFGKSKGLYIIDGQHRYYEGKILQMKIPYIVIAKCDNLQQIVHLMAAYNNTQRKWIIENYIDCYAACGLSDYIYLRQKRGESSLNYLLLSCILKGGSKMAIEGSLLKNGIYTITNKDKGELMLSYVLDLLKINKVSDRAIYGFMNFYNSILKYDHKKFLSNLKSNISLLNDCMETSQYYNKFNEIYNK